MRKFLLLFVISIFGLSCFAQEVLTWSDEFEGTGVPDPNKWSYDLGAGGWGNQEIQTYTNSYQNCRQENGILLIDALKYGSSWTSARIITNNKWEFKYGRVVFRAKLPVGAGTWPALWMLGENFASWGWPACGEIDIMEFVGKNPGVVHSSVQTPSSYGATINTKVQSLSTCSSEFHTYQLNWTYSKLEFSIDSVWFYTYSPPIRNKSTWPFDKPFFLIMNIAMGGTWGSDVRYETGGIKNGIDPALTSARMEVDYVRVYQYPAAIDDSHGQDGKGNLEKPLFFPNPSDGKIGLKTPSSKTADCTIYNIMGADVFHFQSNGNENIDVSFLPKGLYFLSINSDGKTTTQKLVLK